MNLALLKKALYLCLLAGGVNLLSKTVALAATRATVTPPNGGRAISAGACAGGGTSLTGPGLAENWSGQFGRGNTVLNAPCRFSFDADTTPAIPLDVGDNLTNQVIHVGTVLPSSLLGSPTTPTPGWHQWCVNVNVTSANEMVIIAPNGSAFVNLVVLPVVAEPATVLAGATLLVPFGLSTWCALRRKRRVAGQA